MTTRLEELIEKALKGELTPEDEAEVRQVFDAMAEVWAKTMAQVKVALEGYMNVLRAYGISVGPDRDAYGWKPGDLDPDEEIRRALSE